MGKYDLLCLGEILLRLSPDGYERIARSRKFNADIGGAELNVATGAALLGLRTGFVGKLPQSEIGKFAASTLRFGGVSDEYLVYEESPEARLGIYFYEYGAAPRKPKVVYDRKFSSATRLSVEDLPEEMFEGVKCFHTSGITLGVGGQLRQTAVELMKRFKEKGSLISFDVNFRSNLWTGEEARACIEEILPLVDIFFCSEDTAKLTFAKTGNVEQILKEFSQEYDISVVAATQRVVHSPSVHSFGSVIYDRTTDTYYRQKPYEKIEVIDRIGSGDAYVAGVLYGLLRDSGNTTMALAYGDAYSAAQNTVPGDLPAMTADEIEDMIRDHETNGYHSEMKR